MRICKNVDCGKEFEPNIGKQLFCSKKCTKYFHNRTEISKEIVKKCKTRWLKTEKGRESTRKKIKRYRATENGKKVMRRNAREYRKANPLKIRVRNLANKKLIKGNCIICGVNAEKHHPDYLKPLEIIYLCFVHHRELHNARVL